MPFASPMPESKCRFIGQSPVFGDGSTTNDTGATYSCGNQQQSYQQL